MNLAEFRGLICESDIVIAAYLVIYVVGFFVAFDSYMSRYLLNVNVVV